MEGVGAMAPRSTAKKPAQETPPQDSSAHDGPDEDLDLDAYLVARGITERRIKIAGQWFRFRKAVPSATLIEMRKHLAEERLIDVMKTLLVDPGEADELGAAVDNQPQPINGEDEVAYVSAIVSHLLGGARVGESSASSPES